MKHSEMTAMAALLFIAPHMPRWMCAIASTAAIVMSVYLGFHGD